MISVAESLAILAARLGPLGTEVVPLAEARGRVLRRDVVAAVDLPPFHQSAMDGYALRSADTSGASAEQPARLRLVGVVAAGRLDEVPSLAAGQALRIFTGGHLPHGADAVIPQEDVAVEDGHLVVPLEVGRRNDVRDQGAEITAGALVLAGGTPLTPGRLGALSMAGIAMVEVTRRVRVQILTTGDEVVAPGVPLAPGQVFDANRAILEASLGADPRVTVAWEHVADELDAMVDALQRARNSADLIVTTGGVSVGDRDVVPPASDAIGLVRHFWKVAQKPGKPLFFASDTDIVLLGLPGNPGAVFCLLHVQVAAVLDRLSGLTAPGPSWQQGVLDASVRRTPTRARFVRCARHMSAAGQLCLRPLEGQDSHMLGNLADCDAVALVEPGEGVAAAGDVVPWVPVR